jgi:oxaloacetate decarboxylase gamma subunit
MTIVEMLGQSGVLTLLGLGIVFGFLIVLIISVTFMGKMVRSFGADKDVNASQAGASGSSSAGGAAKASAVTAAITVAVSEYRKTEK